MTGRKAPAFQFYADDFMAGTHDMTALERGIYISLLCYQWTKGFVPEDDDILLRVCHASASDLLEAKSAVFAKFTRGSDGKLRNKRLEEVRELSTKRSRSGKLGGQAKRKQKNSAQGDGDGDGDIQEKKKKRSRFTPPTFQEVNDYCRERGNHIDPQEFLDYYQQQGWKLANGNSLRDWRAAVRNWETRNRRRAESKPLALLPEEEPT